MDIRAQFEEWFKQKFHLAEQHLQEGRFGSETAQVTWQAWRASRSAIEVELPEKISPHNTNESGYVIGQAAMYDEAIDDCSEAIRAIGISIKGESS